MDRYIKHTNFEAIGEAGQKKLLSSSVIIIGAGGLGSSFANYFVRSGIGRVKIVDRDKVELSNLQRQCIYDETDIGKPKALCALEKLKKVNSQIKIEAEAMEFGGANAKDLVEDFDLVIDATDNFSSRFIIDNVCTELKKPWIFTGVIGAVAQTMIINYPKTKRLSDIVPPQTNLSKIEPNASSSVLFPAVSSIAGVASLLGIKYLTEQDFHPNTMFVFDFWNNSLKQIKF